MNDNTAIKQPKPKGILLFSALVIILFYFKIIGFYGISGTDSILKGLSYFFFIVTTLSFFIWLTCLKNDSLILSSAIFLLVSVLSTFMNSFTTGHFLLNSLVEQTFFFGVLSITYLLTYNILDMQSISNLMMVALAFFTILYIDYRSAGEILNASSVNSIYYIALILPFAMCNKNNIIKILGIADIFILSMISNKRTAFIMTAVSIAVYFLIVFSKKQKKNGRKVALFFLLTITVGIFIFSFDKLQKYFDFNTFERLNTISEDKGSGRFEIYGEVWNKIKKFNFFEWIFGHGFNGVLLDSGLGISAHNDFLEVLFDYGILGLVSYLIMVKDIFKISINAFKQKSEYFAPCVISIILFMFMSVFSHLIIYPSYIAYLMIFWGCMVNLNRRTQINE